MGIQIQVQQLHEESPRKNEHSLRNENLINLSKVKKLGNKKRKLFKQISPMELNRMLDKEKNSRNCKVGVS